MNQTHKKRILLVDDDPSLVELFTMVLEFEGYQVMVAGDGEEAVNIIDHPQGEGWSFDIIMVDLMLPVMDGLHFMHCLRHEMNCPLPVLVLSGMSKPAEIERALAEGADAVLSKPVEPMLVIQKLDALLDVANA
ncbi:MAG: response regulator transcription factor [Mariprofundus sp.]|nr:response regulator transcription factor [Mariprofundus sp.]